MPHESNNQKAKILHVTGLTLLSLFLVFFQLAINFAPRVFPRVLGYAANISPSEVIRLTNERRIQAGLGALEENGTLSSAALAKGNDMLAKGYWAHSAPDGTPPWSFFNQFGYKYRYAGENLARDFSSPGGAVEAWMASPTHKENILNGNYKEIGIGVIEGNLSGVDTTIIVQFFGTRSQAQATIPVAQAAQVAPIPTSTPTPTPTVLPTPTPTPVLISPFTSTKNVSLAVTGILLLVLSIDLMVIRRRRIMRIGGRTLAHMAYLGMIFAVLLILKAGQII